MSLDKELKDYVEDAKTWDKDVSDNQKQLLKTTRVVAGVFGVGLMMSMGGMTYMAVNKKPPEYGLFEVDKSTGLVNKVELTADGRQSYGERTDRAYLWQYMKYREDYSMAYGSQYYAAVGLMSSPKVQDQYSKYMSRSNPNSPINVYKDNATVKASLKSFSKVNDKTYIVRYRKTVTALGKDPVSSDWVATLVFLYLNDKTQEEAEAEGINKDDVVLTEEEMLVNPLNMIITQYSNSPEAVEVAK
jgi:type IV secretion system protein VirB8